MSALSSMVALALFTLPDVPAPRTQAKDKPDVLRANYVITVADDLVVEVYHNGKSVSESKRSMLNERFGATTEQINEPVHKGDWLVSKAWSPLFFPFQRGILIPCAQTMH